MRARTALPPRSTKFKFGHLAGTEHEPTPWGMAGNRVECWFVQVVQIGVRPGAAVRLLDAIQRVVEDVQVAQLTLDGPRPIFRPDLARDKEGDRPLSQSSV